MVVEAHDLSTKDDEVGGAQLYSQLGLQSEFMVSPGQMYPSPDKTLEPPLQPLSLRLVFASYPRLTLNLNSGSSCLNFPEC